MTQKIGLNMYSLRELCEDLDGLQRTFDKVAGAGYRFVQISGIKNIDPEDIAKAFQASGLQACATHLSWDRFTDDLPAVIDLHKLYGTIHSAIGSLPESYRSTEGLSRFLSEARSVLPEITSEGMDFSYHNHSQEFAHYNGSPWIDQLFEQGAGLGVKFELDTYWVAAGGADPAEYIDKFSEYMSIVHVKDMIVTPEREQRYAPIGSGNLNWRRVFDAIRNAPIEFVIVEQDRHYDNDPVENVAESFRFLKESGFAAE